MPRNDPEAQKAYRQEYYRQNRDEIISAVKSRHDPIKKAVYNKEYYAKNKEAISARERAVRLERQEQLAGRPCPNACEVCGNAETRQSRLSWDHDHTTGTFRGWLCNSCNKVLGLVYDNAGTLRKLADYLEWGVPQ